MRPITFAILFVGLVSLVLLFTSTNVFSLFSEQHTFINIDTSSNDIDCVPCHKYIQKELDNSAWHKDFNCTDCHRFKGKDITFASGEGASATPGKEAHAAYTPRCLDCHGKGGYATPASAFNLTDYGSNYSAHKQFVKQSLDFDLSTGENEACIACHTNYSSEIEYSYFWDISYEVDGWNVPFASFTPSGTRDAPSSKSASGAKHEFVKTSDINCISCHENIYEALVTGTPKVNEDYLTHSPIEIHTSGTGGTSWDTDNPWPIDGPPYHYRYHYIPKANRATGVNSSYCYECHNVNKYANENLADKTTYDLGDVTSDTYSTQVHCAEALWCQTCHGSGKTKVVIDNPEQLNTGHSGTNFVDDVTSDYARTFQGDICMGCHEAAVHPSDAQAICTRCHELGNADVTIKSEPRGYATNI